MKNPNLQIHLNLHLHLNLSLNLNLQKIFQFGKFGTFLLKFDEFEYLQQRKIFRLIGKFSTFPTFSNIPKLCGSGPVSVPIFRLNGESGNFSNWKIFHFGKFFKKSGVKKSGVKKVGVKKGGVKKKSGGENKKSWRYKMKKKTVVHS